MELDENTYKKFVGIVGEKNVSKDPVITQAYAFNWGNELVNIRRGNEPSMFVFAPLAVILPESTGRSPKSAKIDR